MNKEKLTTIKNKIKENAPVIIGSASVLAISSALILATKKFLDEKPSWNEDLELIEVTGENREELMKDDNFCLLKITGDEYMFARRTTED